jgi:hypothetical protein
VAPEFDKYWRFYLIIRTYDLAAAVDEAHLTLNTATALECGWQAVREPGLPPPCTTALYSACQRLGAGWDGQHLIRSVRRWGGLEVAILVVGEATGGTAEQDAAFVKAMGLESSPAPGARIRMAGPMAGGWRIVSLWDSEADWERFRDERLTPALAGVGRAMGTPEIWPIETVLTFPAP